MKPKSKKNILVDNLKSVWENDHAEDVTKTYNEIVRLLSGLDMYSANLVVNLVFIQTIQKSIVETVGGEKDGSMERSCVEGR